MYRIYTERKKINTIKKICNKILSGYTLIYSIGYWENVPEKSIIIEVNGIRKNTAIRLSREIKKALKQKAVLIQKIQTKSQLI